MLPILILVLSGFGPFETSDSPRLERPLQSRSYQRLRGRRLARFEKSKGASEGGNPIEVNLPADCLDAPKLGPLGQSRRWATFVHRGVRYHLRRDDPHFTQTLRKLDKRGRKGATVRWRGRVKHVRLKGKRVLSVRLDDVRLQPRTRKRRRLEHDGHPGLTRHDGFRNQGAPRLAASRGSLPPLASSGKRGAGRSLRGAR